MMKTHKIGIFLALFLLVGFSSCKEQNTASKLLINEVLIDNESNFQDDYGIHSGWVEIFNRAYSSADLAGCYLRVSSQPGDTLSYFIPKGDVLTLLKPRQHALFWADGAPRRGTFHTNFVLARHKTTGLVCTTPVKNCWMRWSFPQVCFRPTSRMHV